MPARGRGVSLLMVGVVVMIFGFTIVSTDTTPPSAACLPGGKYYRSSACGIALPIAYGVLLLAGGLIAIVATLVLWRKGKRTAWGG